MSLFQIHIGQKAGSIEEEMYHYINLKYIPPEQRSNNGEIEMAVLK